MEALEASRDAEAETALQAVVGALGLTLERHKLAMRNGRELSVLALVPASPELAVAGSTFAEAAAAALRYLRRSLGVA